MSVEGAPLSCLVLIDGRERQVEGVRGTGKKNAEQRREWRVRRGESEAGDDEEEEEGGRLREREGGIFSTRLLASARSFVRSARSPLSSSVLILLDTLPFPFFLFLSLAHQLARVTIAVPRRRVAST